MATPASRLRRVQLPRALPLVHRSGVDAPFHRSNDFYVRVGSLAIVVAAALGVLALRAWSLQVIQGPRYQRLATAQSFRTVDLPAARGAILDAKGRLLAGTVGRLAVTADRTALGTLDAHGRWTPNSSGIGSLDRLARLSGIPLATLVSRVEAAVARSPYAPAVVLPRVRQPLADYLEERADLYPGLHVTALPERSYPQGGLGSEYLGLLGEISPAQLASGAYPKAKPGEIIGTSGVEKTYDRLLNGGFRRARVRVDSLGRIVGPLRLTGHGPQLPTLRLTIDAHLQRVAEKAVRDGIAAARANGHLDARAGAAIVMNARTGGLYALASYPTYNQVLAAKDPAYLERLLRDPSDPLLDRATAGVYPTGSTFKPIVAEAALASGVISPSTYLNCTGSLTVGGHVFHNVEPYINESMNLRQALEQSCDTWFYQLGAQFYFRQERGSLDMQNWARRLGLGHPTRLDIPGESAGVVPTPAWLRKSQPDPGDRIWYEGTSVNLSIGQGFLAVTPLQLAVAYAALANGGTVVRPHVADAVVGSEHPLKFPPVRRVRLTDVSTIRDGLYDAAHGSSGTSTAVFGNFPVPVAGKTGTAETGNGSDHSWYASWAPAWNPKVVVVVLIEHGGFGAEAAAPAAKEIYSAFFHVHG